MLKEIIFYLTLITCLIPASAVAALLDGENELILMSSIETNSSSSCDRFYEKFFLVYLSKLSESDPIDDIFKKIPSDYNIFFRTDLNSGRGSYFKKIPKIYLAASYECEVKEPITLLKVSKTKQCEENEIWNYTANSEKKECPGLDLNKGAQGKYLYLYSSTSKRFPTHCDAKQLKKQPSASNTVCCEEASNPTCATRPIKSIRILITIKNKPTYPDYYVYPQDLNDGAGGFYVWLAWQTY